MKLRFLFFLVLLLLIPNFVYANDTNYVEVILNEDDKHPNSSITSDGLGYISRSNPGGARATVGRTEGKYYFEVTRISGGSTYSTIVGLSTKVFNFSRHTTDYLYGYYNNNGYKYPEYEPYGDIWGDGDVIGVALDLDSGILEFFKNGVSQGISHYLNVEEALYPTVYSGTSQEVSVRFNFGATPFEYTIPYGYYSYDLSQSNFNEPEPEPEPPNYNDLEVSNLSYVADETSITLNYQYSSSLSHVKIYRDDELIADQYTDRTYTDSGLGNGQTYIYRITTVDQYGNESQGMSITVTTTAIPSPPANVTVTAMNEALRVNWKKNAESNVTGYNIYMDGSKVNQQLISTNSYVIDGLENGQTYAISVTALNNNGKESDHSTISLGTPNEKGMATVKLPFSLNALSISIANWFGSLWEVIAFCVSIPLAFYLGHKVKELIVT